MNYQYTPPSSARTIDADRSQTHLRQARGVGASNDLRFFKTRDPDVTGFELTINTLDGGLDLMACQIAPGNVPSKVRSATLCLWFPRTAVLPARVTRTTL